MTPIGTAIRMPTTIGEADHPERLRQPLDDQVDDRRAGLPAE